ncbi:hypothetical protein [Cellulomonas sp. PSBB021]|nr:hypothetical protein [Cellulomonas sp. PSBB021]
MSSSDVAAATSGDSPTRDARGCKEMTIDIMEVEEITATRIHLDPEAGGA